MTTMPAGNRAVVLAVALVEVPVGVPAVGRAQAVARAAPVVPEMAEPRAAVQAVEAVVGVVGRVVIPALNCGRLSLLLILVIIDGRR